MRTTLIGILAVVFSSDLIAQEPNPAPAWNVTVGAGGFVFPRYPGSDEYRVLPFPLVQVSFRDRVFLGPSTTGLGFALGAYAIRTPRLGLAVEVGGQDSRPASRAGSLASLEDRDGVGTVGAGLSYRTSPVEGAIGVTKGLNDGAGVLGTARLSISRTVGRFMIGASASAAVADARQMRREFGITEVEATRRQALIAAGDGRLDPEDGAAYRPDAGLRHVGAALSLMYLLSRPWTVIGFSSINRLSDEAAASPLVRQREQFSEVLDLGIASRIYTHRRPATWSIAIVYAVDGVRFLAAGPSRAALLPRLTYVREQAPQKLWPADSSRVLQLLSGGAVSVAVDLYFASVGCRWDEERLHAEEITLANSSGDHSPPASL